LQCARCGYVLDPFDPSCPKCAYLARTAQFGQQPADYGHAGTTPAAVSDGPFQGDRKAGILFLATSLFVILFVVIALIARSRLVGISTGSGSLLVLSSGNPAGGGLLSGAVSSQQIDQRLTSAAATTGGEVEVSLAWNSWSDLDVQVRAPSGELINADNPRSASGEIQDGDANPTLMEPGELRQVMQGRSAGIENMDTLFYSLIEQGGGEQMRQSIADLQPLGSDGKAPPIFSCKPIEHIYFSRAPRGTYTVYAHCYNWREHSQSPLPFTVQVRSKGKIFYETSGTIGPASFVMNQTVPTQVCQFQVK